jgi:hypothetical protein
MIYRNTDLDINYKALIYYAHEHNSLIITKDRNEADATLAKAIACEKDVLVTSVQDYINNTRRIKDKKFDSIVVSDVLGVLESILLKTPTSNNRDITSIDAVSVDGIIDVEIPVGEEDDSE